MLAAVLLLLLGTLNVVLRTSEAKLSDTTSSNATLSARSSFGMAQSNPCFSSDGSGSCTAAAGISQGEHAVVSSDGKHVYVASLGNASVAVFSRNSSTGALTQLASPNRCVTSGTAIASCTSVIGRGATGNGVYDLAIRPDGRHLYATGYSTATVAACSRNTTTGVLTQLASPNMCVSNAARPGCTTAKGLTGADGVAVSPDGAYVYVASFDASTLTVFSRNSTTGSLTQLAGAAGCIVDTSNPMGLTGCATARGLKNPYFMQVSPDGGSVYLASWGSNAVPIFDRNTATGALTQPASPNACVYNSGSPAIAGCTAVVGLSGAYDVRVAPDGASVHALGYTGNTIAAFSRNASTSVLTQLASPNACYSNAATPPTGCTSVKGIGAPTGLQFSLDNRYLFVSAYTSNAVAVFRHDASGVLTQLPTPYACIAISLTGCATGRGLSQPLGVAVSPDGFDFYSVGGGTIGYVAVLSWAR